MATAAPTTIDLAPETSDPDGNSFSITNVELVVGPGTSANPGWFTYVGLSLTVNPLIVYSGAIRVTLTDSLGDSGTADFPIVFQNTAPAIIQPNLSVFGGWTDMTFSMARADLDVNSE